MVAARLPYLNRSAGKIDVNRIFMTDWVLTILPARSFSAVDLSLLESKHLVICYSETIITCEERALFSWWVPIGGAETASTRNCVCIICYV